MRLVSGGIKLLAGHPLQDISTWQTQELARERMTGLTLSRDFFRVATQPGAPSTPVRTVEELEQLSDGEYRTVLAAQRTLLAFLRTALAVLVVFRDSALGPVLASLVATTGILQFATASPLFLTTLFRVYKPDGGSRANARSLFKLTQFHCVLVAALVVACAAVAIPWRYNYELEDRANAQAETDIEVFD